MGVGGGDLCFPFGLDAVDTDGSGDIAFHSVSNDFTTGDIKWYQSTTCPAGRFGASGSIPCADCSGGYFGPWAGLGKETGPRCAGPCSPGQFSVPGSTACSNCSAGYVCGAAATRPDEAECPPGKYSKEGAAECILCAEGRFGATPTLTTSACSGPCPAGYMCTLGTVDGTSMPCPSGTYSGPGSSTCIPCAAGRFGNSPAETRAECAGVCPVGRWGATGATAVDCTGPCSEGRSCPAGLTTPDPGDSFKCARGTYAERGDGICSPCPAGRYGNFSGMVSSACVGECAAGKYCPGSSIQELAYVCLTLALARYRERGCEP